MGIFRQGDKVEEAPVVDLLSGPNNVNGTIGLIAIAVFLFLLEILSWFTVKGGVFSLLSAVLSVPSKPPVLDIDENSLWFPTAIIFCFAAMGFCRLFGIRCMSNRARDLVSILAIIGSSFLLSAAYGEAVITRYMAAQGYSRCEQGDWEQGNRKSRVWFANYVREDIECRRRINTVPEYLAFR